MSNGQNHKHTFEYLDKHMMPVRDLKCVVLLRMYMDVILINYIVKKSLTKKMLSVIFITFAIL